jgi:hypothetical protein
MPKLRRKINATSIALNRNEILFYCKGIILAGLYSGIVLKLRDGQWE